MKPKSMLWKVVCVSVCGTYRETMYADTEQWARDLAEACEADGCWTCTINPPTDRPPQRTGETTMDDRLPTYTVELISKYADMDVKFKGVRGTDAQDASSRCLAMMARPEAWLVVTTTPPQ